MGLYEWYYTIRMMDTVADPWSIRSRFVRGPIPVRSRFRHACRCLTNTPYRVVQNIGVGVHWQGAGVECHLDTLGVTWVVILTLGVLVRYRPAEAVVRYLAELTESQSLVAGWLPLVGTIFFVHSHQQLDRRHHSVVTSRTAGSEW
jgi:hypothetical protein